MMSRGVVVGTEEGEVLSVCECVSEAVCRRVHLSANAEAFTGFESDHPKRSTQVGEW